MLHSLKVCKLTPVAVFRPVPTSKGWIIKNDFSLLKSGINAPLQTQLQPKFINKDAFLIQKRSFNQTPIPRSWRDSVYREDRYHHNVSLRTADYWNSPYLLYALIGANVVVFVLWNTYGSERPGYREMTKHFMVNWRNISEGRVWTLVTSTFSHQQPFHLLFNMLGLYFFGNTVLNVLGGKQLLGIYLLGGISGSLLHVAYENFYNTGRGRRIDTPALGASGSIMSIGMLYACMFPTSTVLIWGIVPVPAVILFGGYFLYDLYNSFVRRGSGTSHSGHVGGALFGLAYYFTRIRGYRLR